MRYIVGIACIALIAVRAIWTDLRFDNISVTLFIISAITFLFPEFGELISRIKKLKIGDVEVELGEKLKELAAKTESAETNISEGAVKPGEYGVISKEVEEKIIQMSNDPRAALLIVAIEIERTLRNIAAKAKVPESKKAYSVSRLLHSLAKREIINPEIVPIFEDFWTIRNQVVHVSHFELSTGKLYELMELGLRILRLLSVADVGSKRK